jgi:hypothetical protein
MPHRGTQNKLEVNSANTRPSPLAGAFHGDAPIRIRRFAIEGKADRQGNENHQKRLSDTPMENPEGGRNGHRPGGLLRHPKAPQGGLKTHQHERSHNKPPLHIPHTASAPPSAEQKKQKGTSCRPDSEVSQHDRRRTEETAEQGRPQRKQKSGAKRGKVPPNRTTEATNGEAHKRRKQTVPVLKTHHKIRPPTLRIQTAETQRPIGHGHACLPACHESPYKDQAKYKRDDRPRSPVEVVDLQV